MAEATKAAVDYVALKVKLTKAEGEVKDLKRQLKENEGLLITDLTNAKVTGLDVAHLGKGYRVGMTRNVSVSLKGGQSTDDAKRALLEKVGFEGLVKKTCNSAAFGKAVRDYCDDAGLPLTDDRTVEAKIEAIDGELAKLKAIPVLGDAGEARQAELLQLKSELEVIVKLASFFTEIKISVKAKAVK